MYNEELCHKQRAVNEALDKPAMAGLAGCGIAEAAQERVHRPGMVFEEAVHHLKRGARISRRGWNGKGQFVFEGMPRVEVNHRLRPGAPVSSLDAAEAFRASYAGPVFCLFTAQGTIQVGWLATQSDMQGHDWYIVD